jgi:hypothetical protein
MPFPGQNRAFRPEMAYIGVFQLSRQRGHTARQAAAS